MDEDRALSCVQQCPHRGRAVDLRCLLDPLKSAGLRGGGEIDAGGGVARLHAGLAVAALSSTAMARLFGGCADGGEGPMPISMSPSPVSTSTRRAGWASAMPSPTIAAPPMAPQR